MKRTRDQNELCQHAAAAFACSFSHPRGEGVSLAVHLPAWLLESSPVLTEAATLGGVAPDIGGRPECLLAWLAWHAHSYAQKGQDQTVPAWDSEADAFSVRIVAVTMVSWHFNDRSLLSSISQACCTQFMHASTHSCTLPFSW